MPEIFGLREYHEFELDEYLEESSSPAQGEGFIKPFDVDVGVDLYVRHLPLKQDDEQLHPWRDAVWQDPDWMWGSTRLSAREAMFWFMATTLPERHQDTQLAPKGAEILRRLDLGALSGRTRISALCAAAARSPPRPAPRASTALGTLGSEPDSRSHTFR